MIVKQASHLPVIEIQHVEREGHYVLFNQKQIARFDGPTAYEDATRCCAVLVQNEIAKLGKQQPVQQPELPEHEQYRQELVERARAKYPDASPELAARIDKEITRRVEMVQSYQAHLERVFEKF
jgi:hypothetical protein